MKNSMDLAHKAYSSPVFHADDEYVLRISIARKDPKPDPQNWKFSLINGKNWFWKIFFIEKFNGLGS